MEMVSATVTENSTVTLVVNLVLCVLSLVAEWRIFTKAGQAGWKCLIPLYNSIVELGFTWKKSKFWSFLLAAVVTGVGEGIAQSAGDGVIQGTTPDVLQIVAMIMVAAGGIALLVLSVKSLYYLAKSFGHGVGFTIGLLLFGPLFRLILGLGSSEYQGNGYHLARRKG